jgi:hypothetical protein
MRSRVNKKMSSRAGGAGGREVGAARGGEVRRVRGTGREAGRVREAVRKSGSKINSSSRRKTVVAVGGEAVVVVGRGEAVVAGGGTEAVVVRVGGEAVVVRVGGGVAAGVVHLTALPITRIAFSLVRTISE